MPNITPLPAATTVPFLQDLWAPALLADIGDCLAAASIFFTPPPPSGYADLNSGDSSTRALTIAFDTSGLDSAGRAYTVQFWARGLVYSGGVGTYKLHPIFQQTAVGTTHDATTSSGGHSPDWWYVESGVVSAFAQWSSHGQVNPSTGLCWTYTNLTDGQFGVTKFDGTAGRLLAAWNWFITISVLTYPQLDSLTVTSGSSAGGTATVLNVDGNSLYQLTAPIKVFFGGVEATNVVMGVTTISCMTPAHASGLVDVTYRITYEDGTTEDGTLINGYEYIDEGIEITGSGGVEVSGSGTLDSNMITGSGGVEVGGSATLVLSVDISGIYQLTGDLRHDTLYARDSGDDTIDVAIPEPFVKIAYLGF